MPQFRSLDKGTQKIAPAQIKEAKLAEELKLTAGAEYTGSKGGKRVIVRIIFPVFYEGAQTEIVEQNLIDRKTGREYYIYNTPNAFGTACVINFYNPADDFLDVLKKVKQHKYQSCSPSEFKKWMDGAVAPVIGVNKKNKGDANKLDQATLDAVIQNAKMMKDEPIMGDVE